MPASKNLSTKFAALSSSSISNSNHRKRILFNHELHPAIADLRAGRFGPYGGRYVPETLMVPLFELERAYEVAKSTLHFNRNCKAC